MKSHQFQIQQIIQAPIENTFDFFSTFTNFEQFWPGKFKRIIDGHDTNYPFGLGAVRGIDMGFIQFEETIVGYESNKLIQYTITKNSPYKDYLGSMEFFALNQNETLLRHTMQATPKLPGTYLTERLGMELIIKQGIKKAAKILAS